MALLAVLAVLILAISGSSGASWCVCKGGLSDAVLQKALDWACGNGADCNPIKQTGTCYQPNTIHDHCSYAVNSYYQKKGQTTDACNFAGAAMIATANPSVSGCSFPASASSSTGTTTTTSPAATTTPITTTPTTTTTTASPYTATPTGTGIATGVSPSASGMSTETSHGGLRLLGNHCNFFFATPLLILSSILLALMHLMLIC